MSIKTISRIQFGRIVIFLVALALTLGLLAVSYSAAVALLLGVVVVWLVRLFARLLRRDFVFIGLAVIALVAIVVISILALLGPQIANIFSRITSGLGGGAPIIEHYQAVIVPLNPALETFVVKEEVDYTFNERKNHLRLPERQLTATHRGLFINELTLNPLGADSFGTFTWTLPDGTTRKDKLCSIEACPTASVELKDWPTNSFYATKDVPDVKQTTYLDTQTLDWSISSLSDSIQVAYISSPFYSLRGILGPFVQASSIGDWLMTLLGILVASIVSPAVKATLGGVVQNRFKALIERTPPSPGKKTTLIVSAKGEEKEIEVKDKHSR